MNDARQPAAGLPPVGRMRVMTLPDEVATAAFAGRLAGRARAGDVICLWGDLGAGKSTFARAFIRTLMGARTEVPSPTFTLVQGYEAETAHNSVRIAHFDLYRLSDPEEVHELGFEDAAAEAICLVEWPDRLGPYLPSDRLDVELVQPDPASEAREARLSPRGAWSERHGDIGP